jgi:signal transduction histidine kinase
MRDLLEYGRPTTQRIVRGPLPEVVAEAAQATLALAERRCVRVDSAVQGELPRVLMDRRRMVQVFQNLIDNAIRHAPDGGAVLVSSAVERSRDGGWIVCTVDDDGPGFPPGEEGRVFQPFFTRRRGGTGLGLSIAQRIVEEHGGSVAAANRLEGGARLTVRLPVERA